MEEPTPIPPIVDSGEPRFCPGCGTRVADLATTCLMCGAALNIEFEVEEEAGEEQRPRFQIPWRSLIAGVFTALVFVAVIGWLVRAQIVGQSATSTPALIPTKIETPTRTPRPTETPLPTPTFTPIPPLVHQVQTGETCSSVAGAYGIMLELLVAHNPVKCGPDGIIRPLDLLLIPAATPTPGPTITVGPGTPLPTAKCPLLHIVQPGDTGLSIADLYEIPFNLVETANPQVDFTRLQINQVLQIPCGEPAPTATPTTDPNATPTPVPKYSAPALLSPAHSATITGSLVALQWTAVSLLRDDETYAVRLRRLDEDLPVESIFTRTTLVRLTEAHAPSADDPEREYTWEVTVVRAAGTSATGQPRYEAASHTSSRRTFRWVYAVDDEPSVGGNEP